MSVNSTNSTVSTKETATLAEKAVRTRQPHYQEYLDAAAVRGFERIDRSQSWNEGKVYHGLHIRVIYGRRHCKPCQHMRLC